MSHSFKVMLIIVGVMVLVFGMVLSFALIMNANRRADEASSAAAAQQAAAQEQQAASMAAEAATEKKKADMQQSLNDCLDKINKYTLDALNQLMPGASSQGILQIQQSGIDDCKARYGAN